MARETGCKLQNLEFEESVIVQDATERINRPRQLTEVRHAGHPARTGAAIGLTSAGVKEAAQNHFQRTRGGVRMGGTNCKACRGSFNQETDTCQTILHMKQHQHWHRPDQEFCTDEQHVTVTCSNQTLRSVVQHMVAKSRVCPHGDECRQRIMEAVEEGDEGKMKTFLDKYAPRRSAPEVVGEGGAAPVVVAPAVAANKRGKSSSSAPASAGIPEQ